MQLLPLLWLFFIPLVYASYVSWRDIENGRHGSYPTQQFVSSSVRAPFVNFIQKDPICNDGQYYFLGPRGWKNKNPGPMILNENGTLIWSHHFDNEFGGQAYDLRVQQYKGQDYLTFWLGDDRIRGHGAGHYYMLNSSYDIVHKVGAANNKYADLHEFSISPQGTALLMIFEPIQTDVRPVGRKFSDLWNQAAWDCIFQEIDIETGSLIFEWRASDFINMTLSYNKIETPDLGTREKPFDWIHLNSIDKDELGNYLISARNMHAVIYIDGKTKEVIWTLGGKGNYFQDLSNGHALNMAWQHDAKFVSTDAFPETYKKPSIQKGITTKLMTVFDNAALDWDYEYGLPYSRALLLELTFPTSGGRRDVQNTNANEIRSTSEAEFLSKKDSEKVGSINGTNPSYTVRVLQEYINPQKVRSSTQGSVQLLPQGKGKDPHIFVGYGINAVMTEFYSNGSVACDIHFGARTSWESGDIQSYRAYKLPWIGKSTAPPSLVVKRGEAYVSWDGATEVREWLLLASQNGTDGNWEDIALVPKTGFETIVPLKTANYDVTNRDVMVLAIDKTGRPCENGKSLRVSARRFASSFHLDSNRISYLVLVVMVLVSATVIFLLSRKLLLRRRITRQSHHLD